MLTLSQLSHNKLPYSVLKRSEEICGVDYNILHKHLSMLEISGKEISLTEINNAWLKLNECALYCHNPKKLRVEILESNKTFCDYDAFSEGEYIGGKRIGSSSYEQMYLHINPYYLFHIPNSKIDEFIQYNNRNEFINNL